MPYADTAGEASTYVAKHKHAEYYRGAGPPNYMEKTGYGKYDRPEETYGEDGPYDQPYRKYGRHPYDDEPRSCGPIPGESVSRQHV